MRTLWMDWDSILFPVFCHVDFDTLQCPCPVSQLWFEDLTACLFSVAHLALLPNILIKSFDSSRLALLFMICPLLLLDCVRLWDWSLRFHFTPCLFPSIYVVCYREPTAGACFVLWNCIQRELSFLLRSSGSDFTSFEFMYNKEMCGNLFPHKRI